MACPEVRVWMEALRSLALLKLGGEEHAFSANFSYGMCFSKNVPVGLVGTSCTFYTRHYKRNLNSEANIHRLRAGVFYWIPPISLQWGKWPLPNFGT